MSEASIAARAAMKAKAHRLVQHNNGKVDATSGDLPKAFDATPKTGQRPTTKAYASGGKVHGEEARKRADKMPRKKREDGGKTDAAEDNATTSAEYRKRLEAAQSGKSEEASERKHGGRTGKMGGGPIDPRAAAAANMAMANQQSGVPTSMMNFGGVKKGLLSPARIVGQKGGKMKHDDEAEDKKLIKSMVKKEDLKRAERKHGGRTGKTAVNIVIATGHKPDAMGGPGAPGMPPHPIPPQMAPPSMPPGAGPAMMPPQGPPGMPPGMPPMGRKSGGRTTYPIDTGAGGGEARLAKIRAYGATQK